MSAEAMQLALGHVQGDDAAADPVVHHQIDGEILHEEGRGVAHRLLVERVQHRVPGAVGRRAGALRGALAEVRGHAAEGPLVDAPLLGARERHAVVLELDHRRGRLLAHELDRILIAQPVRPLDRVVHVPTPVVLAHVTESRADTTLGRNRVASCREELGDAGGREPRFREPQRRA
jgi:hypothetical protein